MTPSVNGTSDLPIADTEEGGYGPLAIVLPAIFLIGLICIAVIAVWKKRQSRNSNVGRKGSKLSFDYIFD